MSNSISCTIQIPFDGETQTFEGLFERPKLDIQRNTIPVANDFHVYTQGRATWSNVNLKFYDEFDSNMFNYLNGWLNAHCRHMADENIEPNYPSNFKKTIRIVETGTKKPKIVGHWELTGAHIISYNTNVFFDDSLQGNNPDFLKITRMALTRKVLFEKRHNPTLQVVVEIELSIDYAALINN